MEARCTRASRRQRLMGAAESSPRQKIMPKRKVPRPISYLISDDEEDMVQPRDSLVKREPAEDVEGPIAVPSKRRHERELYSGSVNKIQRLKQSVPVSVQRMNDCFRRVHEDTLGNSVQKENLKLDGVSFVGGQIKQERPSAGVDTNIHYSASQVKLEPEHASRSDDNCEALSPGKVMQATAYSEAEVMTQVLSEVDVLPEQDILTQILPTTPQITLSKRMNSRSKVEKLSTVYHKRNSLKVRPVSHARVMPQPQRKNGSTGATREPRLNSREATQIPSTSGSKLSQELNSESHPVEAVLKSVFSAFSVTSTRAQLSNRFSPFKSSPSEEVSCVPFNLRVQVPSRANPISLKKTLSPKLKSRLSKTPPKNTIGKKKLVLKRLQSATDRKAKASLVRIKEEPVTPGKKKVTSKPANASNLEQEQTTYSKFVDGEIINVDEQPGTSKMSDGLWDIYEIVSNKVDVNYTSVKRVVQMLEQGATIPFICRYRREQSGGLSTDSIQMIQDEHKRLLQVRKKAEALSTKLAAQGQLTSSVRNAIFLAKSCDELDLVAEPLKTSGPRTYAGKARSIGLEPIALSFWRGEKKFDELEITSFVDPAVEGKRTQQEVLQSIQYILADELRKDRVILDTLNGMSRSSQLSLLVKKKKALSKVPVNPKESEVKFQDYFQFQRSISAIDSHQVLAINRGENLGFLSVAVQVPDFVLHSLKDVLRQRFGPNTLDKACQNLIESTVSDCSERLCKPYLTRMVRAHLKERAENEAIKVFASNLRSLLMASPVRGEAVLGVDPGFANGCKMAMISKTGEVLSYGVMYPDRERHAAKRQLARLITTYECNLVAVGDGKGSQQVKAMISECSREGLFAGQKVRFSTVREAGVSVYSVSAEAEKELPGLDSFVKSAVAIARRLQDPLVEYVKVEPRHLGVGMYQHDINESRLKESLQGTVVECVSFVGVDVNVCPEFLLRQVAGLNAMAARNIIEYRQKHGPFMNREQLQLVPHIGPTRYEQCAGFVKILPETVQKCLDESVIVTRVKKPNMKQTISEEFEPLDTTIVHPESYSTARAIIKELNLDVNEVGTPHFIAVIVNETKPATFSRLISKLSVSQHTVEFILKALAAPRGSDLRDEGSAPIFSESLRTISDVRPGDTMRGKVMNVVPFGAFVDVALGNDVLLPTRFMGVANGKLHVGDAIEGRVMSVEPARNRVAISFIRFL
ncbi:S1 RNA-binding domain-containing protein 1-like isoform X2 [Varroa jacobsoni]|uniref:S1 RNA-binding domain-containing protein 1-like isoform X2 n=1 Tax=Varroa jacobsoni TaxID=62625 RepID=UPI000BF7013B|nr:S1 RNA-binding domain-containing protein 1-like isoform X2 [Varroa jacobsoni]